VHLYSAASQLLSLLMSFKRYAAEHWNYAVTANVQNVGIAEFRGMEFGGLVNDGRSRRG